MALNVRTNYTGSGVYAIIDFINFRAYIGSSDNIRKRGKQHETALKRGQHSIKELQASYNNKNQFYFIILEKCNCSKRKRLLKEYCYMYRMIELGFSLYNSYGKEKESLKNIIVQNSIIDNCNNYLYDILRKKYKGFRGKKN